MVLDPGCRSQVDFGLRIDPLSLTFVLLITGVGFLIHVYSIGYMGHDGDRRKFFAYLNLFVASMLLLVLGNSFVTLYFGWEGVGLASYLLIGFWSDRPAAATAAKKAFIMNRVGDVGLALAIFLMFKEMGTTSFDGVFDQIDTLAAQSPGTVTAIGLLLLLGACGKSGQIPLQAWLPDAMEGPTPVSALIHAATMVTAGVYLIARSAPLFDVTPDARWWWPSSALRRCSSAPSPDARRTTSRRCWPTRPFRRSATCSWPSGSVPARTRSGSSTCLSTASSRRVCSSARCGHARHEDDVDMRRMGGLARRMPITFVTMACGYLALIAFPFTSGFYSKDPIIESAFAAGGGGVEGWLLGLTALLGAGFTAFYATRLMIMTFFGEPRWKELTKDGQEYHPHEAPAVMTVPMIILAIGSLGAGAFFVYHERVAEWLTPSLGEFVEMHPPISPVVIEIASIGIMLLGVFLAYWFVGRRPVPLKAPERVTPLVAWARADVGGNAINETLVARPSIWLGRTMVWTDVKGVDGAVNGVAAGLGGLSGRWRRWQNGFVRSYAMSMLAGTLVLSLAVILVRFA